MSALEEAVVEVNEQIRRERATQAEARPPLGSHECLFTAADATCSTGSLDEAIQETRRVREDSRGELGQMTSY